MLLQCNNQVHTCISIFLVCFFVVVVNRAWRLTGLFKTKKIQYRLVVHVYLLDYLLAFFMFMCFFCPFDTGCQNVSSFIDNPL